MIQAGTGKDILDAMRIQFNNFIQTEMQLNIERSNDAKRNVKFVNTLTLWLTIGTIVIGFLLAISISRSVTRPLQKIIVMANNMAAGNVQQVVDQQNRHEFDQIKTRRDEMGDIGRAYDALAAYFCFI